MTSKVLFALLDQRVDPSVRPVALTLVSAGESELSTDAMNELFALCVEDAAPVKSEKLAMAARSPTGS